MNFILPLSKYICALIRRYSRPLDKAEGEDHVKPTCRDNDNRLVGIKGRYDPTNLFLVDQNIKPKGDPYFIEFFIQPQI
jgi:hypothetical protein